MIFYKTDGTREGILNCLFRSFSLKETPVAVYSCDFQPSFGSDVVEIESDEHSARRVRDGLIKCGGISLLSQLFVPLRSSEQTKETVIFSVAYRCLKERKNVLTDYSDVNVLAHYDLTKRVYNELHRMKGFLRFTECEGGLYAHFSPDNDIVDMLAPHFLKRLCGEKFIIHDTKRGLLALCDGKDLITVKAPATVTVIQKAGETEMKSLWKTYFDAVAIESRKNPRLQDNYLPRRYRKNMDEFF